MHISRSRDEAIRSAILWSILYPTGHVLHETEDVQCDQDKVRTSVRKLSSCECVCMSFANRSLCSQTVDAPSFDNVGLSLGPTSSSAMFVVKQVPTDVTVSITFKSNRR